VIVYRGGEVYNTIATGNTTAYWDTGTLSFDSANNITCSDVPVWNMNNVWCENIAGITGLTSTNLYEDYTKFGSYRFLGQKQPYFNIDCESDPTTGQVTCDGTGLSYIDDVVKSISILHYTNNAISNLYGEYFYTNTASGKYLKVTVPDMMYHRMSGSTGSGTTMGMSFIGSGATRVITDTDIQYIDLIEEPTMINSGLTSNVVGKIFPQLKTVVFTDDEIVAALSYKSNRNWTLPALSANLTSPTGGPTTGILGVNQTMYLTYLLDNLGSSGLTATLPCQKYIKVTNTSSSSKDVQFNIEDLDMFPYMRKIEDIGYDGLGFYATNFKLLYQIVSDNNSRPNGGSWKVVDFTTTGLTTNVGETINPLQLEVQDPLTNNFLLTSILDLGATTFDLYTYLNMPLETEPYRLKFGD
jgi:hypothetical protein